jgi:ATP synthase protein I
MLPPLSGVGNPVERERAAYLDMADDKKPTSLQEFDARLRHARDAAEKSGGRTKPEGAGRGGLGFAMRIGVELVAALIVGVAIGYFLDQWLGTKPWLMLLGFVLGSVAGFLGVYRAAKGLGQTVGYRHDDHKSNEEDGGDRPGR